MFQSAKFAFYCSGKMLEARKDGTNWRENKDLEIGLAQGSEESHLMWVALMEVVGQF